MSKLHNVYYTPEKQKTDIIFASEIVLRDDVTLQEGVDNNTLENIITFNNDVNANVITEEDGRITVSTNGATHTVNLYIPETALSKKLEVPIIQGTTRWMFEADEEEAIVRAVEFVPPLDKRFMTIKGDTAGSAAGTRVITVVPRRGCKWLDGSSRVYTYSWAITPRTISIPYMTYTLRNGTQETSTTIKGDYSITFNAATQAIPSTYETNYVAYAGLSTYYGTGTYRNVYALRYPNSTIWTDNSTTSKTYRITVNPKTVTIPALTHNTSQILWDTEKLVPKEQVINVNGIEPMFVDGASSLTVKELGTYTISWNLIYPEHTMWTDSSTDTKSQNYIVTPKILTADEARYAQSNTLVYNYKPQSATFNNYTQFVGVGGNVSATNAGTYHATAVLVDPINLRWPDGTNENKSAPWVINRMTVTIPRKTNVHTYNGTTQTVSWNYFKPELMTMSGQTVAVNAGTFTTTFDLIDKVNMQWEDKATAARNIGWSVNRMSVNRPYQNGQLYYTGSARTVVWADFYPEYMTLSGTTTATNAGTYWAYFTPTSNYSFNGTTTSLAVQWVIIRNKMPASYSTNFTQSHTYNGSNKIGVKNYNSTYHTLWGTTAATNAGTYTFYIAPKGSYEWYQGGQGTKTFQWVISRALGTISVGRSTLKVMSEKASNRTYITTNCGSVSVENVNSSYASASVTGTRYVTFTGGRYAGGYTAKVTAWDNNHTTASVNVSINNVLGRTNGGYDVLYWNSMTNHTGIWENNTFFYIWNQKTERSRTVNSGSDPATYLVSRFMSVYSTNWREALPTEDGTDYRSKFRVNFYVNVKARLKASGYNCATGAYSMTRGGTIVELNAPVEFRWSGDQSKSSSGSGSYYTTDANSYNNEIYMHGLKYVFEGTEIAYYATSWMSIKAITDSNTGMTVFSAESLSSNQTFSCNDNNNKPYCHNVSNCSHCNDCNNCSNCYNCADSPYCDNCNNSCDVCSHCADACNCNCDCDCNYSY